MTVYRLLPVTQVDQELIITTAVACILGFV